MLVAVAGVMLAVSISIVAMPGAARETLTASVGKVQDRAAAAGAPPVVLRLLADPDRVVGGLRLVGVLYAIAAGALLVHALR